MHNGHGIARPMALKAPVALTGRGERVQTTWSFTVTSARTCIFMAVRVECSFAFLTVFEDTNTSSVFQRTPFRSSAQYQSEADFGGGDSGRGNADYIRMSPLVPVPRRLSDSSGYSSARRDDVRHKRISFSDEPPVLQRAGLTMTTGRHGSVTVPTVPLTSLMLPGGRRQHSSITSVGNGADGVLVDSRRRSSHKAPMPTRLHATEAQPISARGDRRATVTGEGDSDYDSDGSTARDSGRAAGSTTKRDSRAPTDSAVESLKRLAVQQQQELDRLRVSKATVSITSSSFVYHLHVG